MSSTLEKFGEVVGSRHEYAREWKSRKGRGVFGYICTYVPEEIIYAAGILPVRVLGGHEPVDMVEPHIHSMFCPFSRDVLGQALKGRYSYLDGLTVGHTCMHMSLTKVFRPPVTKVFRPPVTRVFRPPGAGLVGL